MTTLSKTAIVALYNDLTTGQFKDAQAIPIDRLRDFVQDITDSALFEENVGDGPWKQDRVRLKTATALPSFVYTTPGGIPTITASSNGSLTVDGVSVVLSDAILVSEESTSSHNGVYTVLSPGTGFSKFILELREDSRTADQIALAIYQVREGNTNTDTLWKQTFDETGGAMSNIAYEEFRPGGNETETETSIVTADILTANATPVDLVTAPGSGKVNIPLYFIVTMDYNSVAYATNVEFAFQYDTGLQIVTDNTFLIVTSDTVRLISIFSVDGVANSKIQFKVNTGNPTAGNSNITIVTKYRTITI